MSKCLGRRTITRADAAVHSLIHNSIHIPTDVHPQSYPQWIVDEVAIDSPTPGHPGPPVTSNDCASEADSAHGLFLSHAQRADYRSCVQYRLFHNLTHTVYGAGPFSTRCVLGPRPQHFRISPLTSNMVANPGGKAGQSQVFRARSTGNPYPQGRRALCGSQCPSCGQIFSVRSDCVHQRTDG